MDDLSISLSIGKDKYKTTIRNGSHELVADEPESLGGTDLGFGPKELLLSSLGSCIAMTIRMYADRKKMDLQEVQLTLRLKEVQSDHQTTSYINSHIRLTGDLDEKERSGILAISKKCPVHKILTNPIIIENNLVL